MQHHKEALNTCIQLYPHCCSIRDLQMAVVVRPHWPIWSGAMCARTLRPRNDYYFKAEVRSGLLSVLGAYRKKRTYNNNQVRGGCKFNGMQQTLEALSDNKMKH